MTSWAMGAPRLVVRVAGQVLQEIELEGDVSIGSGQDNELSLADPRVANRHAHIDLQDGACVLSGVDDDDPVWVNGQRLLGRWQLRDGDQIVIGDAELTYHAPDPESGSRQDRDAQPGALETGPGSVGLPGSSGPQSGRRWPLFRAGAGGIVLVLAIVAVAVYYLVPGLFGGSEPTPRPTPLPSASAVVRTPAAATPPPDVGVEDGALGAEEFDAQLEQAGSMVEGSDFEGAIALYADLAQRQPDDARPETGWAWALAYDMLPDQALVHGQRALERDPTSADVLSVLSRAAMGLGDIPQALDTAQRAVEANATHATARAVLAQAYLADGKNPDAAKQVELGLALDPDLAELHRVRGMLYQAEGNLQGAVAELRRAAEAQPELWLRQQELGQALLGIGHDDEAILALKSALALRGKPATYTALGEAYSRLGELDRARSYLEQALSAGAIDADTYGLLSAILAQQGLCDDSRVYVARALEEDPTNGRALQAAALCQEPAPTEPAQPVLTPPEPIATRTPGEPQPTQSVPALTGRIAFPAWSDQTGQYEIYVAQPDGEQRTRVAAEMHQPSFSPGGEWLASNGERPNFLNLFVLRADGADQQEITQHAEDGLPHWSPDGRSLVFSSTQHGDKRSRIYVLDDVPFGGSRVPGRPLLAGGTEVLGEFPFWMPDGRIVYSGCDYAVMPATCGLLLVAAEPGGERPVPVTDHGGDNAPAAFGDRIAFMSDRDGNWEIYAVNADASDLKRLTDRMANDGLPTWSPDGRTIAFVSDQGGTWALWAMSADGSDLRKLFDIGGGGLGADWLHERISWGP